MSHSEKLKTNMIHTNQTHLHEQNADLDLLTCALFLCNVKMKTGSMEYHNSSRMQKLFAMEEKIVLIIFFKTIFL